MEFFVWTKLKKKKKRICIMRVWLGYFILMESRNIVLLLYTDDYYYTEYGQYNLCYCVK